MSKNMDDFDKGTALILEKLYESFPQKVRPLDLSLLDHNISEETLLNFSATCEFLADEGFIICGNSVKNGSLISHARLTSKGLATLKMIPESIDNSEKASFAEKINSVIKTGSKHSINVNIRLEFLRCHFFQNIFKFLIQRIDQNIFNGDTYFSCWSKFTSAFGLPA